MAPLGRRHCGPHLLDKPHHQLLHCPQHPYSLYLSLCIEYRTYGLGYGIDEQPHRLFCRRYRWMSQLCSRRHHHERRHCLRQRQRRGRHTLRYHGIRSRHLHHHRSLGRLPQYGFFDLYRLSDTLQSRHSRGHHPRSQLGRSDHSDDDICRRRHCSQRHVAHHLLRGSDSHSLLQRSLHLHPCGDREPPVLLRSEHLRQRGDLDARLQRTLRGYFRPRRSRGGKQRDHHLDRTCDHLPTVLKQSPRIKRGSGRIRGRHHLRLLWGLRLLHLLHRPRRVSHHHLFCCCRLPLRYGYVWHPISGRYQYRPLADRLPALPDRLQYLRDLRHYHLCHHHQPRLHLYPLFTPCDRPHGKSGGDLFDREQPARELLYHRHHCWLSHRRRYRLPGRHPRPCLHLPLQRN